MERKEIYENLKKISLAPMGFVSISFDFILKNSTLSDEELFDRIYELMKNSPTRYEDLYEVCIVIKKTMDDKISFDNDFFNDINELSCRGIKGSEAGKLLRERLNKIDINAHHEQFRNDLEKAIQTFEEHNQHLNIKKMTAGIEHSSFICLEPFYKLKEKLNNELQLEVARKGLKDG